MSDNIPAPTIFQLTAELIEVNDWYSLGVALRVHPNKLQEIQKSSPLEGIKRWRIDLLQYWLNSTPDASWNDIIVALKTIGHQALSAGLRKKYIFQKADEQDSSTTPDTELAVTPLITTTANTSNSTAPAKTAEVIVPEKYRSDFEDIQNRFAQLFDEVAEILENEESVTPERLKRYVSRIPEMNELLDNVHTISDIINIIQKNSSFTRYTYLNGVVTRFNVSSATEKIKSYSQFINEFCHQKLTQHIYMKPFLAVNSIGFTSSSSITFKLRWNPAEKTLSDIQDLLRQAFDEQNVYVHIMVVRGGSVRVICYAPQYLMTKLVRLAQKNRELLMKSSVTYLRVGDTIVVDTSDQNEISLVKDLVLQLTIALELKDTHYRLSGADSQAAEDELKNMSHSSVVSDGATDDGIVYNGCQHTQSEPSSSIWRITLEEAVYILTYKPDGTYLVRERSGKPVTDPSSSSITTHFISVVVNGRVEHVSIYKRGHYYGPLNNEQYTSVEHFVAVLSRAGFTMYKGTTSVTLTNRLLPDKDTLANLPSDIPNIIQCFTFSDVASSLPKHYPHRDESTWLCRLFSKEESERLLRGRIDETFLVRATDLSSPSHIFTVDIVVQRKVVSLFVYRDGDWLKLEGVRERYDSINTLVMLHVLGTVSILIGDHKVLASFRYPVHSSKYYK